MNILNKNKIIGLLVISIFIISLVPYSSAEEKLDAAKDNTLVTTPLNKLYDKIESETNTTIPQDPFYNYLTNNLKCDLTLPEYVHLIDVMANQSKQQEGYDFYIAYTTKPNEVYNGSNGITGTPTELIAKMPYYKSIVDSWNRIVSKYGTLSLDKRVEYLNSIDSTNMGVVAGLYKNSNISCVMYMLNKTQPIINKLKAMNLQKPAIDYVAHLGQLKDLSNGIHNTMNEFTKNSTMAYNQFMYYHDQYNIEDINLSYDKNTSVAILNDKISDLNDVNKDLKDSKKLFYAVAGMLTGMGGAFLALGLSTGIVPMAVIAAGMIAIGAILFSISPIFEVISSSINTILNNLKTLRDNRLVG